MIYKVQFGRHGLRFLFNYPDTGSQFGRYLENTDGIEHDVWAPPELIEQMREICTDNVSEDFLEFRSLVQPTSRKLLEYESILFHSVSFIYKDRAWLLAAPSGTGKTTQFLNWSRLFPNEIRMICGDMPVISCEDDEVWVYPSPWNGSERMGSMSSAKLAGIVFLAQDDHNEIVPLSKAKAVMDFCCQALYLPYTEEQACKLSRFVEKVLSGCSQWQFKNLGNYPSTMMLRDTLIKHIMQEEA